MPYSASPARYRPHLVSESRHHPGWLRTSVTSGFIVAFAATVSMAIAYGLSGTALLHWFPALVTGDVSMHVSNRFSIAMSLTVTLLIPWAVMYGSWFASRLAGPGWKRGAMFSLIPWSFSIGAILPFAGAGVLGSNLDAGVMPVLGTLIMHLTYGAVLGAMFDLDHDDTQRASRADCAANASAERSAACGLILGGLAGFASGWLIGPSLEGLADQAMISYGFGLAGAAVGMMVGSLLGIRVTDDRL